MSHVGVLDVRLGQAHGVRPHHVRTSLTSTWVCCKLESKGGKIRSESHSVAHMSRNLTFCTKIAMKLWRTEASWSVRLEIFRLEQIVALFKHMKGYGRTGPETSYLFVIIKSYFSSGNKILKFMNCKCPNLKIDGDPWSRLVFHPHKRC